MRKKNEMTTMCCHLHVKGVETRGKDDDDLCDRCHLLFFKGTTK
jgi:hypothetical protein